MIPKSISIIGLGLLGGSIGLTIKSISRTCFIKGYDESAESRALALERGAIDTASPNIAECIRGASLVLLCVPVGAAEAVLKEIALHGTSGLIVSDVTSTKRTIIAAASRLLPEYVRFVGSHPVAGGEKSGISAARPDLLINALCILTPDESTDAVAIEEINRFWLALRMRTVRMSPAEHDRQLGLVSHLPHALAAVLTNVAAETSSLAGRGFADMTRIAAGNPALWRDILLDNADSVRDALINVSIGVRDFADLLQSHNGDKLLAYLTIAAERRAALEPPLPGPRP